MDHNNLEELWSSGGQGNCEERQDVREEEKEGEERMEEGEEEEEEEAEAAGGITPGLLWPDSVGFRENDPKKGVVYLILRFADLITQVPLRGKATASNGEVLQDEEMFGPKQVTFRIKVTTDEREKIYEYKKSLAKQINAAQSDYKFDKNGQVKLRLMKTRPELSWAPYKNYLTLPDQNK